MTQEPCPICGGEAGWHPELRTRDIVTHEPFTIARCTSCTVLRTLPVPADLARHYDTDLGRMMKAQSSALHAWLKSCLLCLELRRITTRLRPGTVLDIGCGAGEFAAMIHRRGFPVVAVDAAPERPVAIAGTPDIPYRQIEFERYTIRDLVPGGPYTVIARHVVEHLKDPLAFVRRMIGYGASAFYLVVPNAGSLERRWLGQYWNLWDPPRHLWHFNRRSLSTLVSRAGLDVSASGFDTIPNLLPSLYRFLRLKGAPPAMYQPFDPKGALSALSAPLNLLAPANVLWLLARRNGQTVR